jgi:medium-chain acyl-[acyl-carrier-protein] hydrolase
MLNSVESNSWFIRYKPNPLARLRLFCFPYAGGGASSFYTWANELPSDVEIIAIQMPGLESRLMEPPITNVPLAVQMLEHVIYPKLGNPFAFFGHSLGAIISFELTRKLRQQYGFEPVHLFVSGKSAPQIPDLNPPIHHLPQSALLEELHRRYSGIQDEILQDPDIIQEFLPGLRASFEMYESYSYVSGDPLDCPITAFGGRQDNTARQEDIEAWRHQTKGPFILHMIPGNHFFLHFERQHFLRILYNEITKALKVLK